MKYKILIVDDHAVFRDGLQRLIGLEPDLSVCGQAGDADEAMEQALLLSPDLSIVDVSLEGTNGIDLTKMLRARFPQMRILVLSMHKEVLYAERALRAGANGYIMKRENGEALIAAMRQVLSGQTHISQEFNEHLLEKLANRKPGTEESAIESLTDRELEIFRLIGQGYGTKQIADSLQLSMKTVIFHRANMRVKLNLNNTFELVQLAIHSASAEK